MKTLRAFFGALWCLLAGCSQFQDTTVHGVPNLSGPAPRVWGMGQPTDNAGWDYVRGVVAPNGQQVLVVKLDDAAEGDDSYVSTIPGWTDLDAHMPPEDDKPWTVLEAPPRATVVSTLQAAVNAYNAGCVVVFHCKHGRDRTRFMIALFMREIAGWTKQQGWNYMLSHGFRWELPDLDFYYLTESEKR